MDRMGKHSTLTRGQSYLLAGFTGLGAVLTPLSFLVMFLTVNKLLGPYMDGWAWVVPIGTEAGFTGLFLADILLESRRVPAWLLRLAPYAFAAVSLWLNAAAGGSVIGMAGHSVLPMVFFGYLLAAKVITKRLSVTEEDRRRKTAAEDAVAHARDILRAALGFWWRWRVPVLLRRQIRSRRLPAAVTDAIGQGVVFGGAAKWEPAVEAWITRSLALPEGVTAQLAAAREAAAQVNSPATPKVTPTSASGQPAEMTSGQVSGQPEVTRPATPRARAKRKVPTTPRRISDADLKRLVRAEFDADPSVSVNAAAKNLGRSRDRVRPLLEEIRREARVTPMELKRSIR